MKQRIPKTPSRKRTPGAHLRPRALSGALPPLDDHFRILFDTMSQGVIFRDGSGKIISANPAAERILGRNLEDLLGKTGAELHEDALREDGTRLSPDSFPADVALRTGQPVTNFVMGIRNPREQEYRWISVNAMPIVRAGEDRPSLVYILFDDITERRRTDEALQKAHNHLEQEVQERTCELAGANEELSAQITVRKIAEAALRESEEKFRRLAENAEDLIFLYRFRPHRGYDYVSPSAAAVTGYTPAEYYANRDLALQIVHADDRRRLITGKMPAADVPRSQVLRWVRKDGRTIWIEQRNMPITDASGCVVALQGIVRDITERVRTEEKLRENEKFLQTVIDTEPECVKMLAADGTLLMMNRAGLDMIQADSLEQVRGKALVPLIAPEHRRAFTELLVNVFRGSGGRLSFEMIGLKGRRLWMDTHTVPLRDDHDTIIAALGITRDITEQKKMETLLRESEAGLREAQRLAHVGSWSRDPRTNEVRWSEEVFRILGMDPDRDAASYDAFLRAIHPQDRQAVAAALTDAQLRRLPYDTEFRIVRPNGAIRHVHSRAEVVFDNRGTPVSLSGTLQDLTERRMTEELLPRITEKVTQKTGDEFFRSVSEFVALELGADYTFVVERVATTENMRSVAAYAHGVIVDNFEYALADTSFQNVIGKAPCFYPDRMQELFPRDHMLRDLGIVSYAGIPLVDSNGRPLGGLLAMGCRPFKPSDSDRIITLLQIFSGRTAAELERRRSEQALQESEHRYKQLLESVTSYLYTVTVENGRPVSTTHGPGCSAVTGYTAAEYAADPILWYRMIHDGDKALVLAQANALLAGGHPEPIEHRVRHKNGKFVWIRSALVPRIGGEGTLIAYDGVITDITEQKRAEEFSRNILETVDEGFLVIDRDYMVISANRAYARQAGMDAKDIIGKKCYAVSHKTAQPCSREADECAVRKTFETGAPQTVIHTHRDEQGNTLFVETKAFPLRDESGHVVAAIEIINNITDKKRLEDQLRHSQKMEAVGLLAGGVSHDFNNILTAIIGYGNLLKMKLPSDDPLHPYVEQILSSSSRAASLTQSLLAFSRKQVINPRPMDLNDAIRRFERLLDRLIGEDVGLRSDLAPGELTVLADSSQVEQVLMHLATNARDAMHEGGTLSVRTEVAALDEEFRRKYGFGVPGTYACISIRDTGIGMDERTRERLFEPFFTTKELGSGTGLGLSIVYGIMKQNKGYVVVESEPGKGSCFRLYFPLIAVTTGAARTVVPSVTEEGHETILLAEDDITIRDLMKAILQEFGYTVIEAIDGEDAVATFKEHRDDIQLAILDVIMPKKNGKDARDAIIALKPAVKTLFLSGYSADILRKQGIAGDGANFILKPISPMDLLTAVRRILDSSDGVLTHNGR
jgi:two-component system cell cycle sensor histidine kinase/response regulator CckA